MSTFETLQSKVGTFLESYQTDLTTHDRNFIEANPNRPFIHITRDSGTHIFGRPDSVWLANDVKQSYLFGTSRPSDIVKQDHELLKTYFNDYNVMVHVYDGNYDVKEITLIEAADIYGRWIH